GQRSAAAAQGRTVGARIRRGRPGGSIARSCWTRPWSSCGSRRANVALHLYSSFRGPRKAAFLRRKGEKGDIQRVLIWAAASAESGRARLPRPPARNAGPTRSCRDAGPEKVQRKSSTQIAIGFVGTEQVDDWWGARR